MTAAIIGGVLIGLLISCCALLVHEAKGTRERLSKLEKDSDALARQTATHSTALFAANIDIESLTVRQGIKRYQSKGDMK